MKRIGSQLRETLAESGYVLLERKGNAVLLKEVDGDKVEEWHKNDHFAGAVIEIDGVGYEFIRTADIFHCKIGSFAFIEPIF